MNEVFCQVTLDTPDASTVICTITFQDTTLYQDTLTIPTEGFSPDYVFPWLFLGFKTLFTLDPSVKVAIQMKGDAAFHGDLINLVKIHANMVFTTREHIARHAALAATTADRSGKLFLNLGDTPMLAAVYKVAREQNPDATFYDACDFLDDYYNHKPATLPSLDDLVATIAEKKIRSVFTHNVSYVRYFMQHHRVFLPAFLEAIGVELVIMDFDTYNQAEGFYFLKKMFQGTSSRRFCIMPHIEKDWDRTLGLDGVRYFPIPFKIEESTALKNIKDDYQILVTTWCRLPFILKYLKAICLFLSYVDPAAPVYDYQYLFHAMVHRLHRNDRMPIAVKMHAYTLLSEAFYQANSLLKIDLIDRLRTDRKIHLYGDDDWKIFFPQHYRGMAGQNDLKRMLDGGSFIQLLLNTNYSYYENNPMYAKVFSANNPYLGFCTVLEDPELAGLRTLEFRSSEELNVKLEKVPSLASSAAYQASKTILTRRWNDAIDDFHAHVADPSRKTLLFERVTETRNRAFEEGPLQAYIAKNRGRIDECLDRLTRLDFRNGFEPSAFTQRPYFETIRNLYHHIIRQESWTVNRSVA